jgi:hypothetical protein
MLRDLDKLVKDLVPLLTIFSPLVPVLAAYLTLKIKNQNPKKGAKDQHKVRRATLRRRR